MFETPTDYPCAISDHSEEGQAAALRWVLDRLESGQHLTVWVLQKSVLTANDFVRFLTRLRGAEVAVGRGGNYFTANGPVLALYADAEDLGKIVRARGITALCVVQWADPLKTWAKEVGAAVLHEIEIDERDREIYGIADPVELQPEVVEALESMTRSINHSKTISAGFEKSVVVRRLLRLHDNGQFLPGQEMMEWAAAHGWRGDNPKRLAEYADRINSGSRPRVR